MNCSFSFIVLLCLSQLCYGSFVCLYWFYLSICTFLAWSLVNFSGSFWFWIDCRLMGFFFGLLARILRFVVMGREWIVEHVVILAVCRSQETRTFHLPLIWLLFSGIFFPWLLCCLWKILFYKTHIFDLFFLQITMALNCLKGFICQMWSFFSLPLWYIRKKNNSV